MTSGTHYSLEEKKIWGEVHTQHAEQEAEVFFFLSEAKHCAVDLCREHGWENGNFIRPDKKKKE